MISRFLHFSCEPDFLTFLTFLCVETFSTISKSWTVFCIYLGQAHPSAECLASQKHYCYNPLLSYIASAIRRLKWSLMKESVFLVLAFHLPVLDGLDQHFQATVHFSLSSTNDLSQQHRQFFPLNFFCKHCDPWAAGSVSKYANHCAILPPRRKIFAVTRIHIGKI